MCRAWALGWAISSHLLLIFILVILFCLLFIWLFFKRDFGGRCWARRWYTSLRAMIYPGFPFSFLSFLLLCHMQEDKKLLLGLCCFSILSSLDSCEASFTILPCTFLLFFIFEDWFEPGRRTRNLKDTPSDLYCVLYVYVYFVFLFPVSFPPPFFLWHIASWASWTNSHIPG